jgi:hypothetical protein
VDARGEVPPAVVSDDEDDVAAVELAGDPDGDRGDRAGAHAGEEALLVEQPSRPGDRVVGRPTPISVPPVPRPATTAATSSRSSRISTAVPW